MSRADDTEYTMHRASYFPICFLPYSTYGQIFNVKDADCNAALCNVLISEADVQFEKSELRK